jgi:hypothetical protein
MSFEHCLSELNKTENTVDRAANALATVVDMSGGEVAEILDIMDLATSGCCQAHLAESA